MRIVYFGAPSFATIPLEALVEAGSYEIVGVVTQPDRPVGRGRKPQPTPVKAFALQQGIPLIEPETLRDAAAIEWIARCQPDLGVVAAYGKILPKRVLELPPLGYINLHPSLLPLYRGPTPVTGAILAGDSETGVSLIKLESKMDAGPILAQQRIPLPPDARAGSLTEELFQLGALMLVDALAPYAAGTIALTPQEETHATYTRLLTRADGQIDWRLPAVQIERMTRAYDPWPGAYTDLNGQQIKVIAAQPVAQWHGDAVPGALFQQQQRILVATGAGALELHTIQPSGKRAMPAEDWWRGLHTHAPLRFDQL